MKDIIKGIGIFIVLVYSLGMLQTCFAEEKECWNYQVRCNVTRKCVPLSWKCDGDHDCGEGDMSDEMNCPPKTCADQELRCDDGTCIPERWMCDGEHDCSAGEDEKNCTTTVATCDKNEFACVEDGQCIRADWKCDGNHDCDDGSDEKDCTPTGCGEEQFKCVTTEMCISNHWVCDGDGDCADGSDEGNHLSNFSCNKTCSEDEFRCGDETRCIDKAWQCDGDFDCPDHSDETSSDCKNNTTHCNPLTEFTCTSTHECVHISWKCDGTPDCEDGSDEHGCTTTCDEGQFQCHNNVCISNKLVCDHSLDCMDGSDEWNCTKASCEDIDEFDCYGDGSFCIPKSRTCDGRNDCQHREDEDPDMCKRDPCEEKQCGDHAHCERQLKTDSAICVCDNGFEWHEKEKTCKDIDECMEKGSCSQICINRKGGYKCDCKPGYVLENHHFCRAEGEQAWLYYANRRDIRRIRTDSHYMEIVVEETENSIALDLDYEENLLFWTDRGAEEIKSAKIGENILATEIKTIVKNGAQEAFAPDGLAVDWLYKHVYWTDTGSDTIKVADYSGKMVKTLIDHDLDDPRAICVDPENGFMYWSDWGKEPKIERSGMDGTGRTTLVHKGHGLEWPNGLTIDYVGRRMYWIDAKLHRIGTAKLDGSDISHVFVDATEIVQPFAISVFEDSLYWTDWHTNTIKSVSKLTGHKPRTISVGSFSVMDIKVYHEQKQEKGFKLNATSLCATAQCEEMCLPRPHTEVSLPKTVVCACSNGKALDSDKKTCITQATTLKPPTVASTKKPEVTTKAPLETTQGPAETTQGGYTVVPGNKSETVPHTKTEGNRVGMIAIIAGAIVTVVLIVVVVAVILVYRRYKAKNKKSMNFDNPVYRKTTTTEEQCMISHEDEQPQTAVTVYKDHA